LIYSTLQERGDTVIIDFQSAAGLVAGRTPVRYQGVEVGTVQKLRSVKTSIKLKSA
jgi:paraquat-inducible protein B